MHATIAPRQNKGLSVSLDRAAASLRSTRHDVEHALRVANICAAGDQIRVLGDALLHLRSAEGKLDRLAGC